MCVHLAPSTSARGGRRRGRGGRYSAAPTPRVSSTDAAAVPAELTGAVKWTTVKIADDTRPTTDSIFLGADQVGSPLCLCRCMSLSLCLHILSVATFFGGILKLSKVGVLLRWSGKVGGG